MACSLDSSGNASLMLCTGTCDPSRKDLSSFRNVFLQGCYIFVADLLCFFSTENTNFLSSADIRASPHGSSLFISLVKCHFMTSLVICTDP